MFLALAIWVRVLYISRLSLPGVCIVITVIAKYKKGGRLAPVGLNFLFYKLYILNIIKSVFYICKFHIG